jgi:uncharacterized membrane protein SirB2
MVRRFSFVFGGGVLLAWMATGTLPFQHGDAWLMQGLMLVALIFAVLSLLLRLREMRARFRRKFRG